MTKSTHLKFHISPTGPKECHASEIPCRYEHFDSIEEAQQRYVQKVEEEYGQHATPLSKKSAYGLASEGKTKMTRHQKMLNMVSSDIVTAERDSIVSRAASDKDYYDAVCDTLNERIGRTAQIELRLNELSPYTEEGEDSEKVSPTVFRSVKNAFSDYQDKTAYLVEAKYASPFNKTSYVELDDLETMGNLKRSHSFENHTVEWYQARSETIGGSDVGAIADMDFSNEDESNFFKRKAFANVIETKMAGVSAQKAQQMALESSGNISGPLYRGTVGEDRIRDEFAQEYSGTVYNTKDQYVNPDKPYQQVNVDGLLSSDNKNIDGILEIKKVGSARGWENNSIPQSYRAQVLYYLHCTGFKHAVVRANINDNVTLTRTLRRDDDVCPGTGISMSSYIEERIEPFYERMCEQRKDD